VTHQEIDFAESLMPGGVQVGWGVSEVREAFVTTFPTMA
jgi:hypothetical protein